MTSAGGSTNNETELAGLNRDVTKSQEITKDTITGALNASVTVDNRLFTSAGRDEISDQYDKYGITSGGLAETIKEWSSDIDENGNKIPGKYPHPLPGLWLSESETGKSLYQNTVEGLWYEKMGKKENNFYDSLIHGDGLVQPSGLVYKGSQGNLHINQYTNSPFLSGLYQTTPFFPSFTFTHDRSVDNGRITDKVWSIPPYLILNAVGSTSSLFNSGFYKEAYHNLATPSESE